MVKTVHLHVTSSTGQHEITVTARQLSQRLTEILRRHSLPLNTRCGERGLCECCQVELLEGELVGMNDSRKACADGKPILVRGCDYRLGETSVVRLHIPPRSILAYQPQVVSDFKVNVSAAHDPLRQWVKFEARLLEPARGEADKLPRILAEILGLAHPPRLDPEALQAWSSIPEKSPVRILLERLEDGWTVLQLKPLAAISTESPAELGVAIDIGTTTVVVMLCDLRDGRILSRSAMFNRQMHLGDDVLTRINLCMTDPTMLDRMTDAILGQTIQPLLVEAVGQAGKDIRQVRCLSVAGNTTMLHLFAHEDPSSIGVSPFKPKFVHHKVLHGLDLKWDPTLLSPATICKPACDKPVNQEPPSQDSFPVMVPQVSPALPPTNLLSDCSVHLLPSAAGYIGADICAGVISSGLIYDDGPSLLVDVGTNGEIVLKTGNRSFACATAAGPAFEGAGLACGSRAIAGAISHLRFHNSPFKMDLEQIGVQSTTRPIGICGSAYVDFLCQARKIGLIVESGRFHSEGFAHLTDHWTEFGSYGKAFKLANGMGNQPVVVTEPDIARLLQAKAAIAAGILTLLNRCGLTPGDVKTVYLAGGFGMHMDIGSAIGCGLLPQFRKEQIELVGNTSLAGAYLALTDSSTLDLMIAWSKAVEVVELNLDPDFESRYIDQLFLPEPA